MLAKRSAKCSTPCRKRSACKPEQIANTSKQSGSSPVRASRCTTPADDAPEGRGGHSNGRVRAMSAYQSNVKVEPPCVARSAQRQRFDRSLLHHINKDSRKAPPAPCSREPCKNEGTPTTSAVHAFGNEHSGASLNAKGTACGGDATASRSWSGRSAWLVVY